MASIARGCAGNYALDNTVEFIVKPRRFVASDPIANRERAGQHRAFAYRNLQEDPP